MRADWTGLGTWYSLLSCWLYYSLNKVSSLIGNGKKDCIPFPKGLKKIKRISFKVFLDLKELIKNFRRKTTKAQATRKNLRLRTSKSNNLRSTIHLIRRPVSTKTKLQYRNIAVSRNVYLPVYEPSSIYQTRNSRFWQKRRVHEWDKYINDPYEDIDIKDMKDTYNLI
ncbi:MAG: hypothetical protein NC820_06340 [Candidatus Omnitrophica bacterium]|nr:hypothetical protein [Candidatus Omnitrophota bacterium]